MGLISKARSMWRRSTKSHNGTETMIFGGSASKSGVSVTRETARQIATVFACIRVISETTAQLPLALFERLDDGTKRRANDKRLYELLHDAPNDFQSSFEFREQLTAHAALTGGGFAMKFYVGGKLDELIPLVPQNVNVRRDADLNVLYDVRLEDGKQLRGLTSKEVFHLRGPSWNGFAGDDIVKLAREAIGLASATEEYTSRFFSNGASPSLSISHPAALKPEAQENLKESIKRQYTGLQNAHEPLLLLEGAKLEKLGFSSVDAQLVETRRQQCVEICKMFRMPPHMVGILDRATFSNIEQQSLEFVVYTLTPWLKRWEGALQRNILKPDYKGRFFAEHVVEGLLRGDSKTRALFYQSALQNGWMTGNEVRMKENMEPLPGLDTPMRALNMTPVTEQDFEHPKDPNSDEDDNAS